MDSLKVLVSGDVDGNFSQLFERVNQVDKKAGPFHLLFVVGNFFGPEYNPELEIPPAPIPTFILGPTNTAQLPYFHNLNGCEIAENITYLGRAGVYNESSGLKIAYLSGIQYDGPSSTKKEFQFNFEDVKNLQIRLENESGLFKGVDILLTSQWPAGIDNLAGVKPDDGVTQASNLVASLTHRIKPRYHFSGLEGLNYERVPYRNHEVLAEQSQHCTRFISLGKVGNRNKKKWIYAFNICPMKIMPKEELVLEPPNITPNPFTGTTTLQQARSHDPLVQNNSGSKSAPGNQFFYDTSYTGERNNYGRGGRGGKRGYPDGGAGRGGPPKRQHQGPPSACWFCLASPEVEKHLVVSIGDSAYMTIAKGGLTPDHLLILPIGHFGSLIECPPEVVEEIDKFKRALIKYFDSLGKFTVFYERNFKSPHLQIQVIPIPKPVGVGLKITCLDYAESEGIEMQEFPANAELFQMTRPGFPYFYMELPDGSKLFCSIKKNFPIQFGRELLASEPILNCPEKVDWKQCKMSKEEEISCTQSIRNSYKPFDFTVA